MFQPEAGVDLAAELTGRHAPDFEKAAVDVVEVNLIVYVRDEAVGLHQQLAGAVDAHLVDEIGEGIAGSTPEEAREAAIGSSRRPVSRKSAGPQL